VDAIQLNEGTLNQILEPVSIPQYRRSGMASRIVHVGVGNFHRAHEAFYTDQLLNRGETDWGICGVCLLERDLKMYQTLVDQDGLYSLLVKEADGTRKVAIIGSMVDYLYAPADPGAVISKMADPGVRIISLTITEGGYNYDPSTGQFLFSEPDIQWDLKHPERPRTIYGYLAAAFRLRLTNGAPGLTVLSCDNIQQNGEVCKLMLMAYLGECMPELTGWVRDEVTFPNSMVDRITPVTQDQDREVLGTNYHIKDAWPVVCEPFIQWVIEDDFSQGRPPWEKAGVLFTDEVEPYEKMKIRLLNAGHSLLGFTGSLYGYSTIDETVRNTWIRQFLREFMDSEVSPLLGPMEGIDLEDYKNSLLQRFANPHIGDQLSRICSESSSKIPKFLLPTIEEQLERGGPVKYSALILAAWCHYLELMGTEGYEDEVQDVMTEILVAQAKASIQEDPLAFLKLKPVFGELARSGTFVKTYLPTISRLRTHGMAETIRKVLSTN
jgi:mannitol 2-dehydrogenase